MTPEVISDGSGFLLISRPPSIIISFPVINVFSSESKKQTRLLTSSGFPILLRSVAATTLEPSPIPLESPLVRIGPGITVVTKIPFFERSTARERDIEISPPFVVE